ncbi:DUF2023 family protein [Puteibacter caeruleilacunae]|nr:DUF2023 family protein [Puteibacter caeruleilacunae]
MKNYSEKEACRSADLQVLIHHIYELKKGIRNMVLHTMHSSEREEAEKILVQKEICFHTEVVNKRKINIFFGKPDCVEVIKSFGDKTLTEYSPEEDFILGIMLGYDRKEQCKRYINRKGLKVDKCVLSCA